MLFDLRARGRRRTVQVVYVGLALLFLVGFIGFGVGVGVGGGGIVEAITGNKEAKNASYAKQIAAAEARTHAHPTEAEAWAKLVDARYHEANGSEFYDENTLRYTAKGKELLAKVATIWNHYVSLKPSKINFVTAEDMLSVYGEAGLNEPAASVHVLQMLIPTRPPTASLYGLLAKSAYQAKNTRVGDPAARKAIALSPAKERKRVEESLAELRLYPNGLPSSQIVTGTTNGKVYSVKVGPKGEATLLKASSAPAKTKTKK